MYLTIDNDPEELTIHDPQWTTVEESLKQIDPKTKCYVILTSNAGSYIQCAGSTEKLTVEIRENKYGTSRHYVIGKSEVKISVPTVWQTIHCRVGPIVVRDNEVLELIDAVANFKSFYAYSKHLTEYQKRNVTKWLQR